MYYICTNNGMGVMAFSTSGTRRSRGSAAVQRHASRRVLLSACAALTAGVAFWRAPTQCWTAGGPAGGRRAMLAAAVAASLAAPVMPAQAFDNAVKQIDRSLQDGKKKGPKPGDLGLRSRSYLTEYIINNEQREAGNMIDLEKGILKECEGRTANCFSTTGSEVDAELHSIQPWRFSGKSPEDAFNEVKAVVAAYKPGQQGIDGGGFKVQEESSDTDRYLYIQYESFRRGYRDDVEFAIEPGTPGNAKEGRLLVRSSSRQGNWDYGVNACRLNTLGKALKEKGGWDLKPITAESHPRYWSQVCPAGDGRKAPFVTRNKFPVECEKYQSQSGTTDNPVRYR